MKVKIIGGPQNGSTVEGVSDDATRVDEIRDQYGNVLFRDLEIRKLSDGTGVVYWPQRQGR